MKPAIGLPCTRKMYSDRHAGTIIQLISEKCVLWQRDKARRVHPYEGGVPEREEYTYARDTQGETRRVTLRKNGQWVEQGEPMTGTRYVMGIRDEHYDFSL
jgi:hypothetical protein